MNPPQRDLTQMTLGVLFIGGLIVASFWILQPFLPAVIWAAMIVVSTWRVMLGIEARLWGKRSLAVVAMTLILLLVLVVPLSLAIAAIADNADRIVGWAKWLSEFKVPPPPDWVAGLPLVGAKAGNFGLLLLQFLLTVVIAAVMYAGGESAADWMKRFGQRLGGKRGADVVVLASQAIRGVALGVVVTAVVQSLLGGIGLAIAGVPMASVLTVLMFMLCIAQLGPILALLPAVAWLYWSGENGWGTFLLVWTLVVGSLDNILRPYLIKKGADLPLLLIFAGVIGGMITIGLVGIFVGPVVLAVAYTLLDAWVGDEHGNAEPPSANT
ncbi:MAG: hypothetical protein H6R21_3479 [Proteobacteria bacterium]|nr:hypothetical protein [Pseudomonadota bacterium]